MALSEDDVRRIISEELANPVFWPEGLRKNLRTAVESLGIQIPQSNIVGTYVVASTVAGLGAGVHGRTGVIRGGASPYDFLKVTYDSVYGKWVSDPFPVLLRSDTSAAAVGFDATSSTPAVVTVVTSVLMPGEVWATAGLTVQLKVFGSARVTASGTGTLRFFVRSVDDGSGTMTNHALSDITFTAAARTYFARSWAIPSGGSITDDMFAGYADLATSAGTATVYDLTLLARWVSS